MKKGFTLAEVLITLGIIGVVASITLTSLIAEHQKLVTVTKLKKAYNDLNNAIILAEFEHGDKSKWGDSNNDECGLYIYNHYVRGKLKVLKDVEDTGSNCQSDPEIVLADGIVLDSFINWSPLNRDAFTVDINGAAGPNKVGRDRFDFFYSSKYGYAPAGFCDHPEWSPSDCVATDGSRNDVKNAGCNERNKFLCGALIMMDGWQIKDDYPW